MLYYNISGCAMSRVSTARLDAAAIGLSLGCAAHCLALPILAASIPLLEAVSEAEWVHWTILSLAAPVAVLALRHAQTPWRVRGLAALGLASMLLGAIGWPSHDLETPLTVAGGLLLAIAHVMNALRSHRPQHGSGQTSGQRP